MAIQKAGIDNYQLIQSAATADAFGFEGLQEANDVAAVQAFRVKVERVFERLDAEMVKLCADDVGELTNWAARMRTVRAQLDELDRHLAFAGKRQFDWQKVAQAMGLLNALRVASEQTVELNEAVSDSSA